MASLRIPARFNGPPESGNGGYTCGLVAGALGAASAEVNLRSPPPLERDLATEHSGGAVTVHDGETLVAEGRPAGVDVGAGEAVSPERADEASRAGYAHWIHAHPFPTCIVCGAEREDGMDIFPGSLGDGRFAAPWSPDASLADAEGVVHPEAVWAALDCPTCAPVANFGQGGPIVLARLAASLEAPVRAGEPHALVSWELGRDGRKREGACVLYDSAGRPLARSRALWIELRSG